MQQNQQQLNQQQFIRSPSYDDAVVYDTNRQNISNTKMRNENHCSHESVNDYNNQEVFFFYFLNYFYYLFCVYFFDRKICFKTNNNSYLARKL